MATYNGHRNWNHWNVSLWLHNDEGLYRMAQAYVRNHRTKDEAARQMYAALAAVGRPKTPDGAPYSYSAIRAAIREL